ncbi:psbP domain-containing protein 2, chloroplastic [Actinidia eriantha]|uniref:psbP domain-containing protein 2, chloroplastic n=1 Tax=Actinidia eriantha TaxID=165200 RepID=UPI0025841A05|nr:psbP domain-containing protein 2, chloroplastic [Actinidia eriantha]
MALSGVCFVPSKLHNLLFPSPKLQTYTTTCFSSAREKLRRESNESPTKYPTSCLRKRLLNLSIVAVILSSPISSISKVMAENLELQRYTDSKEGFTLLTPPSWIKVDKAGATVLFEEPNKAANSVGVVVSPVRLTKLEEFGSPQFVADKLIQAEKRKESTKEAEVIAVSERSGNGGLQVYEIEYIVDSTRGGMKRIFSAVFVASKKLYILNIAHSDKPESPLDMHRRRILEQVLHSFDDAPLT